MKVVAARESLRLLLRWTQGALFAIALSMLAYCGFVLIDTWAFQQRTQQEFAHQLHEEHKPDRGLSQSASPSSPQVPVAMEPGGLIGSIAIPRLGLVATIIEGTDTTTLRRAVGHIPSTGLPGQAGNVGLAGHRDTFFRQLKDIRQNDIITLTTLGGEYRYRVVSTRVVVPTEVSVLNPAVNQVLTLVTCYPFYFIGSAPDRFIVRAERVT